MNGREPGKHRYPVLDSLRGLAAIGVFLTHILQPLIAQGMLNHTPLRIFVNGRCFVIFFFVLSGFVLATAIWNERNRSSFPVYVAKRFVRLYPPYLAAGLAAALLALSFNQSVNLSDMLDYCLALGNTTGTEVNPPSWSLVYELRLSLIMPCLCYLIMRNSKAAVA